MTFLRNIYSRKSTAQGCTEKMLSVTTVACILKIFFCLNKIMKHYEQSVFVYVTKW